MIDVNLTGVFLTNRAVSADAPPGGGAIVNVASIMALIGYYPGFRASATPMPRPRPASPASPARSPVEYATDDIRANAIAPAGTAAPAWATPRGKDPRRSRVRVFEASILEGTPMARRGKPEEFASAWSPIFCSPAASYVTGEVFVQDAAATAR